MLIKVISELVIVFCIVLAIMGIPTQTITKTVKEPVKETHCWCGGIPESLKHLNAKYHLSTYDIEQIDTKFYWELFGDVQHFNCIRSFQVERPPSVFMARTR